MSKSINHTVFIPNPPNEVWEYLTNSELIELWLMKNNFKPVVGHDFQFNVSPMPNLDFDGNIFCKVLEIIPYKKLVYSWKGGPGNGKITMDSVVEFTLQEKNNGTELNLVHSGNEIFDKLPIFTAMDNGWLKNIQKINALLNTAAHGTTNT